MIQSLCRTVWIFLKKKKTRKELPQIPPLGINPEKTVIQKDTSTLMLTAVLFTIARTWKPPKCPSTGEWIKKLWYIYIYSIVYQRNTSHNKE